MSSRDGARLLFALRLAPPVLAGALIAGVCAPSYLWLEPRSSAEDVGLSCLLAATVGAACWARSIAQAASAAVRSSRYLRNCQRAIESDAPVLMLAGVFRRRLVVSRGVRRALTFDELAVAVRHEEAHGASHDNLKRLLLLLAPDAVPFIPGLTRLDRAWSRLAEWAADDRAVDGSRESSLALASALVRVARMGASSAIPLATSLLGDRDDLSVRVERLLAGGTPEPARRRCWPVIVVTLAIGVVAVQPATFVSVHRALEALAH
jgi:beta-lactamase regulating signal transducer with metallopeptidase domain